MTEAGRSFQSAYVKLGIEAPDVGSTVVPGLLTNSRGGGSIMDANVGSLDALCERVITHFTNLPALFPAFQWSTSAGGWQLTLWERFDYVDAMHQLNNENKLFFVVTHVGEIRRTDGASFPAAEGAAVIEAWQAALCSLWLATSLRSRRLASIRTGGECGSSGRRGAVIGCSATTVVEPPARRRPQGLRQTVCRNLA